GAATAEDLDHRALFDIHRRAMKQAIAKAMDNQPDIDWLLENQDKITHKYYERALKGEL
ncbi:MAG: formaldehyde-activating enzyme, partial [Planctomycetota bacterium]